MCKDCRFVRSYAGLTHIMYCTNVKSGCVGTDVMDTETCPAELPRIPRYAWFCSKCDTLTKSPNLIERCPVCGHVAQIIEIDWVVNYVEHDSVTEVLNELPILD